MAAVGTTSRMLFLSWIIAFLLGAAVVYFVSQPYLCDQKVRHDGRPTSCYVNPATRR